MNRWLMKAGTRALRFSPLLLVPTAGAQTGRLSGKVVGEGGAGWVCQLAKGASTSVETRKMP